MIEIDPTKTRFVENIQKLYEERKVATGPLQQMRMQAWQKFLQTELPSRKSEKFRYFPFKEFYLESFSDVRGEVLLHPERIQEEILPECHGRFIVMINGRLCLELSDLSKVDKKIVLATMEKAAISYEMLLISRFQKQIANENDPFVLMNLALGREGGFVYIPPKTHIDAPIQILHFIIGQEGSVGAIYPQWQIFVGGGSHVEFVNTHHFLRQASNHFINQAIEINLEESASITFSVDALIEKGHYFFSSAKISQKQHSRSCFVSVTNGSKAVRQQITSTLLGEGAEADLSGFWLGKEKAHTHTLCEVRHEAPNTTSNQLFKGLLQDESISSFEGKIFVDPVAQKTAAYQLNKNVLLDDGAKAYTKPNLEIFADDVKASHGATVGYFSEEEIFYLASRGIDKKTATRLLAGSVVQDIIEKIPLKSLRENYQEILMQI
ncbi:MAG: Fe-S cluster assembly protein SufD [Chlamydiae bacterium]|nr:Fe-S cluster assembly protein SufD [Chlamydiota bacterium]